MDASGSIQGSEEQGGNALLEEGGSVLLLSVLGYAHGLFWPRLFIVPCFQFLNNLTAHLERFALQWGEWISRSFNSHHIFRKKNWNCNIGKGEKNNPLPLNIFHSEGGFEKSNDPLCPRLLNLSTASCYSLKWYFVSIWIPGH